MKTHTTGKGLALVAGALATAGALAILSQDAIRTGIWTLEHGLVPVLLAVQILTSHLFVTAALQRRTLPALGFALVAAVATWGVLYTSVGKQSAVQADASLAAEDVNSRRADLLKRLDANQKMLDEARVALARECKSGEGKKCKGTRATVTVYEDAVAGSLAALAAIGPAKAVDAKADKMAELVAALAGKDKATVKHVLTLVEPFTYALIFELAALVSFGFAFGHRKPSLPTLADTAQTSFPATVAMPDNDTGNPGNGPGNGPPGGNRRRVSTKAVFEADVIQLVGRGRAVPSQETLTNRHPGVGKGTVSKWLADMEARGLIQRETVGRCKAIRAA